MEEKRKIIQKTRWKQEDKGQEKRSRKRIKEKDKCVQGELLSTRRTYNERSCALCVSYQRACKRLMRNVPHERRRRQQSEEQRKVHGTRSLNEEKLTKIYDG